MAMAFLGRIGGQADGFEVAALGGVAGQIELALARSAGDAAHRAHTPRVEHHQRHLAAHGPAVGVRIQDIIRGRMWPSWPSYPPRAAPMHMCMAAHSSSACRYMPPTCGSRRLMASAISVAGVIGISCEEPATRQDRPFGDGKISCFQKPFHRQNLLCFMQLLQ